MDLACKDLGFAMGMGRELGVPLELAGLVEQTFIRARQQLGGGAWSTAVVKLLEDALGEELRAEGFPDRLTKSEPQIKVLISARLLGVVLFIVYITSFHFLYCQ